MHKRQTHLWGDRNTQQWTVRRNAQIERNTQDNIETCPMLKHDR